MGSSDNSKRSFLFTLTEIYIPCICTNRFMNNNLSTINLQISYTTPADIFIFRFAQVNIFCFFALKKIYVSYETLTPHNSYLNFDLNN